MLHDTKIGNGKLQVPHHLILVGVGDGFKQNIKPLQIFCELVMIFLR